ncbi:hypothetical protein [Streptomyces niveus]|uniref:hypothetical protein n=1 Tax=Streptomyces niveus TaxID=193462 RepID=UPI0003C63B6D|nr:hypothetical protein [Streptomyces niveus]EST17896.1 hypothetical protein M877_40010 [Streptomyces niveus NCIMB 11891]
MVSSSSGQGGAFHRSERDEERDNLRDHLDARRAQQRADNERDDWRNDEPRVPRASRTSRAATNAGAAAGAAVGAAAGAFVPPITVNLNGNGNRGNGGGNGGAAADGDRHQGDRLIYAIERIELRSDRDILALARAINHLGRELHLILGMRAEEVNGVLSTYKGKWYTFGASSRIKARLVSAHLKVSGEAAKALGVGALKMAHAFNRHFVVPEREAKQRRTGVKTAPKKREFTIGDQ